MVDKKFRYLKFVLFFLIVLIALTIIAQEEDNAGSNSGTGSNIGIGVNPDAFSGGCEGGMCKIQESLNNQPKDISEVTPGDDKVTAESVGNSQLDISHNRNALNGDTKIKSSGDDSKVTIGEGEQERNIHMKGPEDGAGELGKGEINLWRSSKGTTEIKDADYTHSDSENDGAKKDTIDVDGVKSEVENGDKIKVTEGEKRKLVEITPNKDETEINAPKKDRETDSSKDVDVEYKGKDKGLGKYIKINIKDWFGKGESAEAKGEGIGFNVPKDSKEGTEGNPFVEHDHKKDGEKVEGDDTTFAGVGFKELPEKLTKGLENMNDRTYFFKSLEDVEKALANDKDKKIGSWAVIEKGKIIVGSQNDKETAAIQVKEDNQVFGFSKPYTFRARGEGSRLTMTGDDNLKMYNMDVKFPKGGGDLEIKEGEKSLTYNSNDGNVNLKESNLFELGDKESAEFPPFNLRINNLEDANGKQLFAGRDLLITENMQGIMVSDNYLIEPNKILWDEDLTSPGWSHNVQDGVVKANELEFGELEEWKGLSPGKLYEQRHKDSEISISPNKENIGNLETYGDVNPKRNFGGTPTVNDVLSRGDAGTTQLIGPGGSINSQTQEETEIATRVHEAVHGINSEISKGYKQGSGGLYLGDGKYTFIEKPNFVKQDLVRRDSQGNLYIPENLRGYRFDTYITEDTPEMRRMEQMMAQKGVRVEKNTDPRHLLDELVAYNFGGKTSIENYNQVGRTNAVSGIMDMSVYSLAMGKMVRDVDPNYWSDPNRGGQLKAFLKYQLDLGMQTFKQGRNMPKFTDSTQDTIWYNLRESPDAESMRQFARETFGNEWTKKVFGF